jgi:hypothetical protein
MVVLDELLLLRNPSISMPLTTIGLSEETSLVGKDRGLENHESGERGSNRLHERY